MKQLWAPPVCLQCFHSLATNQLTLNNLRKVLVQKSNENFQLLTHNQPLTCQPNLTPPVIVRKAQKHLKQHYLFYDRRFLLLIAYVCHDKQKIERMYLDRKWHPFWYPKINRYLCKNDNTMVVVSAREFRTQLGKYLSLASTPEGILLKSRYGLFKISPVTDNYILVSKEEYLQKIEEARIELRAGGGTALKSHEEIDQFLDAL